MPCSGVSQLLIFVSCNVFKIVWLESLPTPLSTRKWLLLERLSIGCLLNSVLYSILPYRSSSSYIVVIQNTLYLSLNLDIVFRTHVKAKLMACSLRSHTLSPQYVSLLSISVSTLLMMKNWNDLSNDVRLASFLHSFRKNLKTYLFAQAYPP